MALFARNTLHRGVERSMPTSPSQAQKHKILHDWPQLLLIAGGTSGEQEVSRRSGDAVEKALRANGFAVLRLDPADKNWLEDLQKNAHLPILNMLHGGMGENGSLQAVLESLACTYLGCDSQVSFAAMNKHFSKLLFQDVGLPTPPSTRLIKGKSLHWIFEYPIVIKPVDEGSSLDTFIVKSDKQAVKILQEMWTRYDQVLVEKYIKGREFALGFIGDTILPPVEIKARGSSFYNYQAKYASDKTLYNSKPNLTDEQLACLECQVRLAMRAFGVRDWGRFDAILDPLDNKFYFLELNTIPGMTEKSLIPKAAAELGMDFQDLVLWLVWVLYARAHS